MLRFKLLALLGSIVALMSACSPPLNWRERRFGDDAALKALLPCQPDQGSRQMPLAGAQVALHMAGCEAGGTLFAIAWADIKDAAQVGAALAQWQSAMLTTMQAASPQVTDFTLKGARAQPPAQRVVAAGRRQDGRAVVAQGVWFARGSQVFHAVMYADQLNPDAAETFFSGLEFQ